MIRPLTAFLFLVLSSLFGGAEITHGPLLGRPGTDCMSLWVRTDRPAEVIDAMRLHKPALAEAGSA